MSVTRSFLTSHVHVTVLSSSLSLFSYLLQNAPTALTECASPAAVAEQSEISVDHRISSIAMQEEPVINIRNRVLIINLLSAVVVYD